VPLEFFLMACSVRGVSLKTRGDRIGKLLIFWFLSLMFMIGTFIVIVICNAVHPEKRLSEKWYPVFNRGLMWWGTGMAAAGGIWAISEGVISVIQKVGIKHAAWGV
jgi:hypothetical protein